MSALFGVLARNGEPIEQSLLDCMASAMAHRGPDGQGVWVGSSVGFGHLMLWTTPESKNEVLPIQAADGQIALTACARLDNHGELIRQLDFADEDGASVSDSRLIFEAYQRWGASCVEHLLGDFAFALWDDRSQRLLCARDHIGVSPLYYFESPAYFAFSTEIRGLLALPFVPHDIDGAVVTQSVVDRNYGVSNTFYRAIKRLPPAHLAEISRERSVIRCYWQLDPTREISLGDEQEYVEQFGDIFFEAVRCRMRSAFPIGAALSGGLDSSSVAGVARRLHQHDLPVFSIISPDIPRSDDSFYIQEVLNQGGFEAHFIRGDQLSAYAHWDEMQATLQEPMWPATLFLNWEVLRAVRQKGIRVYLTGHEGDNVISYGYTRFAQWAYQGNWEVFGEEIAKLATRLERPTANIGRSMYRQYVRGLLPQLAVEFRFKALADLITRMYKLYGLSRRRMIQDDLIAPLLFPASPMEALIHKSHYKRARRPLRQSVDPRQRHLADLTTGFIAIELELFDRLMGAFNVEMRHPFYDKRLIEFCLALPAEQKYQNGWPRYIQRQAMEGILPDTVRLRVTKANFMQLTRQAILKHEDDWLGEILSDPANGKHLNMGNIRRLIRKYKLNSPYDSDDLYLFNLIRNLIRLGWH